MFGIDTFLFFAFIFDDDTLFEVALLLTEFDVDLDITVTLLAVLLVITEPYKIVSFEFAVVK